MNDITTIDTNNYADMAKAMGIANEVATQKKQGIFLARLRINHSPILGSDTIKVKGGTYKLEVPDGPTYYAESAVMRPFLNASRFSTSQINGVTPNSTSLPSASFGFFNSTPNTPCLLYTSPSPRDGLLSRMPSSA